MPNLNETLKFKWEIIEMKGSQRVLINQKSPVGSCSDTFICEIGFPLFERNNEYYEEKLFIAHTIVDEHNRLIELQDKPKIQLLR